MYFTNLEFCNLIVPYQSSKELLIREYFHLILKAAISEWFIIIVFQDVLTVESLFCSTTNLEICLALQTI